MTRRARVAACAAVALATFAASCAPPRALAPVPVPPAAPESTQAGAPRDTSAATAPPRPAAGAPAVTWQPALGTPRLDSLGRIDWSPRPRAAVAAAAFASAIARANGDTLAAWRALAADTAAALYPYALRVVARAALAARDTGAADSALAALAAAHSPWAWEAVRTRCDLALARGVPAARVDSLLEHADADAWTDLERAARLSRRMAYAATTGDTARAAAFARQLLRRYPAVSPAGAAIALLERQHGPLGYDDARLAAESARLRGDRDERIARLRRARAVARGADRADAAAELARALREARRWDEALAAVAAAPHAATGADVRARLELERARTLRDANRRDAALRAYAALDRTGVPDDVGAAAAWERALELAAAGRDTAARAAFARASRGGDHAAEARLLRGLSWVAAGEPQRAPAEWEGADGEAFEFWRAVLARGAARDTLARSAADGALRAIAARPGWTFYRVAARDTLGVRGWPRVAPAAPCDTCLTRELALADALLALGDVEAAMLVVQRASAVAPADTLLAAAALAIGAGRMPLAIRLAQRALDAAPRAAAWVYAPWLYPPAHDSLYATLPRDGTGGDDAGLLRAIAWQESRFDPRARSRSDALGLYQLKAAAASDMAKRLGIAVPSRDAMFDPAASLRLGREYVRWLVERFDGAWIVALSAYNAGPSTVSPRWALLRARGGDALYCELLARAETRDYVRLILGARAAYRETGAGR